MTLHEFTIIGSGLDPTADDFESRFFDAGCEDATISFQKGHIIIDFAREASSVGEAISSAVEAVESVGTRIDRIEPDPLVNLSDIAARAGMSRAAMTQYYKGQRSEGFPAPIVRVTSDNPLWDWYVVAQWLFGKHKISKDAVLQASVMREANSVISSGERPIFPRLKKRLSACREAP